MSESFRSELFKVVCGFVSCEGIENRVERVPQAASAPGTQGAAADCSRRFRQEPLHHLVQPDVLALFHYADDEAFMGIEAGRACVRHYCLQLWRGRNAGTMGSASGCSMGSGTVADFLS